MPLIARKSGHAEASLAASDAVLAQVKEPEAQASAWFVRGLVCERNRSVALSYGNEYDCESDVIDPFLRAFSLSPSKEHEDKVLEVLEVESRDQTCEVPIPGSELSARFHFSFGTFQMGDGKLAQVQRIYVLHPATQVVNTRDVSW